MRIPITCSQCGGSVGELTLDDDGLDKVPGFIGAAVRMLPAETLTQALSSMFVCFQHQPKESSNGGEEVR